MSESRRYDDDEIREIFDRATRVDTGGRPALAADRSGSTGMTLAELQEIGREAGIEPARVVEAAEALDRSPAETVPVRRQFGVPISAGRVVHLAARLSDEDWDRLVVRLRDLFHARGTVSREGTLRSWSNGNLQVLMEPTREGYRLRMRTLSSDIRGRVSGGAAIGGMGLGLTAMAVALPQMELLQILPGIVFMGGAGLALFGSAVAKAVRWRPRREAQFEEIGALAQQMAEARRRAAADDDLRSGEEAP